MKSIERTLRVNLTMIVLSLSTSLTLSAGTQNSPSPGPSVADAVSTDQGLVAYYPLDGDVLDASGNGHHGTNTGITFQPARMGLGAFFDGDSSRHVRVDNFPEIRSNLTVAAWFKPQQLLPGGAGSPLIGQGLTTQSAYTVFVNYNFVNGLLNWNSPDRFDAQVAIPTLSNDTFYHVALVYDTTGGKVRIYLNGVSQAVFDYSTPLYAQTEPLYLGVSFPGGLEVFRGVLDDVRIYHRALSGDEVAALAGFTNDPPIIVVQPRSRTNVVGSSLMLSVTATGTEPLAYQWFKSETAVPGATGRTLVLANVQPADAGTFAVRVSHVNGSVVSSNAVLTVLPVEMPSVIAGPIVNPINGHEYYLLAQSTWVEAETAAQALGGHLTTLRSTAEQQWVFTNFSLWGGQERILWIGLYDADPVSNATNPVERRAEFVWSSGEPVTYANWSAVEPNNYRERGEYYVHTLPPSEPTEPGAWVDAWDLDFNGRPLHGVVEFYPGEPPAIVLQPGSRTNVAGSSLMLSVTAEGTGPLSYQWFKDGGALTGATGRTHVVPSVQPADAGAYQVRVSGSAGFVFSSNAAVTVIPAVLPSILAGPITNLANNHKYYLLDQSTWVEAEGAAQALGGHLATLRNAGEQQWVFTQFSTWGGQERILWLGLHDADPVNNATNFLDRRAEFVWSSGEPLTYDNWSAVEPNNYRERGEYYVHTLAPSDPTGPGAWVDAWDVDFNGRPLHGVVEVKTPIDEPASWTLGEKSFLLIRVNFPDDLAEPISEEDAYTMMEEVNDFYLRNSYGKYSLRTTVTPLLTMPRTKRDYLAISSHGSVMRDARQIARAAGYDTATFDIDCAYFTHIFSGLGGSAEVRGMIVQQAGAGVVAHELGHVLGLHEADSWIAVGQSIIGPGESRGYGNLFDIMGAGTHGQFNTRSKEHFGWLSDSNVATVFMSGTYRLYTFEATNLAAALPCALVVRKDEGRDYWLEFRTEDTNQWVQNGVLISWNGSPGSLETDLLNMNPGLERNITDALQAPLLLGRTFSDRDAGIHITPLRRNATTPPSMDVVINVGEFPANQPPAVTLTANATEIATGAVVAFTANASDANGDALSFAWDFRDGTLGTIGPQVSHTWNAPGEYVVRCVVSDLKGGVASAFVVIRVGTPTTRRISGRIMAGGQPLEGVRVVTAFGKAETYTDGAGHYTLANLPSGRYSVVVLKAYYQFSPTWRNVNATTSDASEVNYDAIATDPPNDAPFVRLQLPNHAAYPSGVRLDLRAEAFDDGSISEVAYYDGANWLGNSTSQITWTPAVGQHLLRAVATDNQGLAAGSAEYEITVVAGVPANDNFAQSAAINGPFASMVGHNFGATAESNEPSALAHDYLTTNSVWYSWTAPTTGPVRVAVKSEQLDIPVVIAYTGNTLTTLMEVVRSADVANADGSSITFFAAGGTMYRILVAGRNRQAGGFVLELWPAQPPINDAFANRILLTGLPVTVSGSNHDATREPGEPWLHQEEYDAGASVWWSWTATSNGVFAVETTGSTFPVSIGVFQGNELGQLVRIADGFGDPYAKLDTLARFRATAGSTYQIAIDGQQGTRGNLNLTLRPARPPANDDFADRILLSGTNVIAEGSTVDASLEIGESHGYGGGTVWWSWTASFDGLVNVRTDFPTALAIYKGATLSTLDYVWGQSLSVVPSTFNVVGGTAYQIALQSRYGAAESFRLRIELERPLPPVPPMNDDFNNRASLSGFVSSGVGVNADATTEVGEPHHSPPATPSHSMWWTWTAPATGAFVLDAEDSTFATALAIYTGDALEGLVQVANNTADGNQMTFSATAGTAYQIAVDGKSGATGNIQFTLRSAFAPPNDSFTNRIAITGSTVGVIGFNTGAGAEPGEPRVGPGGASVWWAWTATNGGLHTVTVTGTTFRVLFGVFAGSAIGGLASVAGDSLASSEVAAQATFRAEAGTTYQIVVDGWSGTSGAIQLDLRPAQPPLNDSFANRIQLTGTSITREANNFEASTEPNEPRHYPSSSDPDGASVWWTWTPPVNGKYTVQLSDRSQVRVLAIYTGNTLSSLTRVAEGPGTTGLGSRASFLAVAGTEYQIAVAGSASVTDEFTLTVRPAASPPNDDFVDRELLAGTGLRIRGSTVEAIREPNEPVSGYGASVWYTWIAPATGPVTINTEYNEAPTGLTVYAGNTPASLVRVPQNVSSYGGYGVLVTFSAVAGQAYQIMVHSIYGSQGTFHLRLIETPAPVEEMPVFALPVRFEDGAVQLHLSGQPNRLYILEASEDLESWIPIATNSSPSGLLTWTDVAATNFTQRFYRARLP